MSRAASIEVTPDVLVVRLTDGRVLRAAWSWYPRLAAATEEQRQAYCLIGDGQGISWPLLDEDLSVAWMVFECEGRETIWDATLMDGLEDE